MTAESDFWADDLAPPIGPAALTEDEAHYVRALRQAPKVELHIHVEGSIPSDSPDGEVSFDDLGEAEEPKSGGGPQRLAQFFRDWYSSVRSLRTPRDFHRAAAGFVRRLNTSGIVWAEAFVSPSDVVVQTDGSASFRQVLEYWISAFQAASVPNATVRLIVDLVRTTDPAMANQYLDDLLSLKREPGGELLLGIGLGGPEQGNPLTPFQGVFDRANAEGLLCVAHCGESTGSWDIGHAVDSLRVQRIGHALSLLEDPQLYQRVLQAGVGIEACPISNLRTGVIADLAEHPLVTWLKDGARVCIGTDDPALLQTELTLEFLTLRRTCGLTLDQTERLLSNAFAMSTMSPSDQAFHLERVRDLLDSPRAGFPGG